jgi:hypothetical protein
MYMMVEGELRTWGRLCGIELEGIQDAQLFEADKICETLGWGAGDKTDDPDLVILILLLV